MMTYSTRRTVVSKESMDQNPLTPPDFEVHSPTGSSEDSVEVRVEAITSKTKRKPNPNLEPSSKSTPEPPPKKRLRLHQQHFRPWSPSAAHATHPTHPELKSEDNQTPRIFDYRKREACEASNGYFRPPSPVPRSPSPVPEPVALIVRKRDEDEEDEKVKGVVFAKPETVFVKPEVMRVPIHPQVGLMSNGEAEKIVKTTIEAFPRLQQNSVKKEQRNYKNMTRERRIEANARERTRVHTISAAFDTLRRSVPSYSSSQKLSKLSVLRVACSYITALTNLLDGDEDTVCDSVDQVTKTIQREGKLRKKKEDDD